MRPTKNILLPLIAWMVSLSLASCEKREDYSHIIFKNYLTYEINRATNFLNTTTEGTAEGEYNAGSKQAYQDVISAAKIVDEDADAAQDEVDLAYESLLQADEDFFDEMVPFRSAFQEIIDYAEILLSNTEEGDTEGFVKPGNLALLQDAVDDANTLLNTEGLTQRKLDQGTVDLNNAIVLFNGEIIGRATIVLHNTGFEMPGYGTEDFGEVDGWSTFGNVESWAPLASVKELETAPEGAFVARFGSYTQGIYQQAEEMIQPNAEYTLEFEVSLQSNQADWQGKKHPAILQTRLIVFEEEVGDHLFATVLSESYDTLGIQPGGFIKLSQTITIDAVSTAIGKKLAVDFEQRHTWNAEEPIWAESFVALDNVGLFRK
jgi:hypothetical protein